MGILFRCTNCGIEKQLTVEFFKVGATYKNGFRPVCKECVRLSQKEYRALNKKKLNLKRAAHYANIKDRVKEWDQNSKANKRQKLAKDPILAAAIRKKRNERHMYRYRTDPIYKLKHRLRGRLYHALRQGYKTLRFTEYLGCTLKELREHLKSQWSREMSWDNYGKLWEIDHILPLSLFDLTDEYQLRIAGNFKNLQPMLSSKNRAKSNKLIVG